eukprot:gene11028-3098_t
MWSWLLWMKRLTTHAKTEAWFAMCIKPLSGYYNRYSCCLLAQSSGTTILERRLADMAAST